MVTLSVVWGSRVLLEALNRPRAYQHHWNCYSGFSATAEKENSSRTLRYVCAEQLSKCHTMFCIFTRQVCQELSHWGGKSVILGAMQDTGLRGKTSGLKWGICCSPLLSRHRMLFMSHRGSWEWDIVSSCVWTCFLFGQHLPWDISLDMLS